MIALVPEQLFRLLELVALLTLIVGGIAIVALLLSGLFWLREWWEARRARRARRTVALAKVARWSVEEADLDWELLEELDREVSPAGWLDSEPFTDPLDWSQGQPHPYDYKPREPMIWGRS